MPKDVEQPKPSSSSTLVIAGRACMNWEDERFEGSQVTYAFDRVIGETDIDLNQLIHNVFGNKLVTVTVTERQV